MAGLVLGALDGRRGRFRSGLIFGGRRGAGSDVGVRGGLGSAVGGERSQAFEGAEDRCGPGPVGGEVQGDVAGVAGELPGDVQDAVAQPFGLADRVLAVEREQLGPDHDVVGGQRELEPRGVRVEGVERQVGGAGRLERLDAVLDLGVLAVQDLKRRDVRVVPGR